MNQETNRTYAVLTGDIIDLGPLTVAHRKKLIGSLTSFFSTFKGKGRNAPDLKITVAFYRGERFQGVLETPEKALLLALLIRTYLQGLVVFPKQTSKTDARISLGLGTLVTWGETLAESAGEAFHLSESGLDSLKKRSGRIAVASVNPALDDELETALLLLEGLIDRWTVAQAEVIHYKLQHHTDVAIAAMLKVTQPTVSKHAKAAHWPAVDRLLTRYQTLLSPPLPRPLSDDQ